MKIVVLATVNTFLDSLELPVCNEAYKLLDLLEQYGHSLSMPVAKPIGGGLWNSGSPVDRKSECSTAFAMVFQSWCLHYRNNARRFRSQR